MAIYVYLTEVRNNKQIILYHSCGWLHFSQFDFYPFSVFGQFSNVLVVLSAVTMPILDIICHTDS